MWRGIFSRRDPLDLVEKIDRQRYYQNRRLVCGIWLSPAFDEVQGALVVVDGCGQWMKLQVAALECHAVPAVIAAAAEAVSTNEESGFEFISDLQADLTEIYAQVIWRLKAHAGRAAEQVLAVAIDDPGIWFQTEGGARRYVDSLCAADALAEKSALTTIDALPARDVAVGGYGCPLSPLPCWFLFADRHEEVATSLRLIVCLDRRPEVVLLPASAGLDQDLPGIQWYSLSEDRPLEQSLRSVIERVVSTIDEQSRDRLQMVLTGKRAAEQQPALAAVCDGIPLCLSDDFGIPAAAFRPSVAALCGMAYLDQTPINLPHLTGSRSPRILGRCTPGKPSNWRKVLMNMNDYRPPTMKLRDAI